jgi:hypothetical protein
VFQITSHIVRETLTELRKCHFVTDGDMESLNFLVTRFDKRQCALSPENNDFKRLTSVGLVALVSALIALSGVPVPYNVSSPRRLAISIVRPLSVAWLPRARELLCSKRYSELRLHHASSGWDIPCRIATKSF